MALRERFENLDAREQKLLVILGGTLVAMVVLLIPLGVTTVLSQRQEHNENLHRALDQLHQQRDKIRERKAVSEQVLARYKTPAPALAGYLTKLADASEVEIPEIKDRSALPIGKKYEERSTDISIKQVGMKAFLDFVERIAKAEIPVSITKLAIRRRAGPPDKYDIDMTVSAYHRVESKKTDSKKSAEEEQ